LIQLIRRQSAPAESIDASRREFSRPYPETPFEQLDRGRSGKAIAAAFLSEDVDTKGAET
jgi:hypothetical protein